ncbi:HAD family hydrolase [Thermococcus thioreducens]|uniref:2-haloalkanoic acid dehalogenase n=1 Tax=Thermococcus thioreducens TaxID=277988 RepID=A0A0Q2S6W2_9EURY|nr:HAD family hydrolase [Thermococcus thioreducens]ASJ12408.1 2-haloalkanoic acid dehalogenase [Thermococcus thioreducens]KQH83139.1 2-haloalkanoic acid dehalogenase [Thermococcus thioreducens]SEV91346.1 haloacid dehalogenase superfamily, subfamily IA, variant 3 with third motif having DD or ED/haloacid dehalogenase superfamily, subfamily IA, variant 1 with third motif having Dx(3-4)D or Dx(3-4)E [Thermococcus thioreducens]
MLKGLIFDVDETLVYYEGYNHREWYEMWVMPALQEHGIKLDYETYKKTVTGELPRSYVERFGIDHVEFWKIVDAVNLRYRREMARLGRIKPFPDVGALGELKKMGLRLAAVSNASQECTEFVLNLFDLGKYFDVVYGKDYSNLDGVKPSPYLVEKALRVLGLRPEEAMMVGDSHHDVLAGKRAGMKTVNVTRFGEIGGADYYVKDLWELVGLIRKILGT